MTIDRRRGGRSGLGSARGSASLVAALWVVVLTLLGASGAMLGSVLAARSQVGAAADLGALAGASAILEGSRAACARARSIVAANGAALDRCEVDGAAVRVHVSAPAPPAVGWLVRDGPPRLRARAHAELTPDRR